MRELETAKQRIRDLETQLDGLARSDMRYRKKAAELQAENKRLKKEFCGNAAIVYNQAILATPTGKLRNKLTELNILRLQALQEKSNG